MDDQVIFPLAVLFLIGSFIGGAILGDRSADSRNWDSCIKYHDQKPVVEANKLCKEILGRTK